MKRARLVITAIIVAALVVAGLITVSVRNGNAPAAAVSDYVDAIARGDAAAANAAVDPTVFDDGADPEFLAATLAGARERISIIDVSVSPGADRDTDVVPIQVTYSFDGVNYSVELRAERTGTTAGVFHDWTVLDPLLVPLRIETNEPRLDTAFFGETAVPTGGEVNSGYPDRRFFVYPGVYDLTGVDSAYLGMAEQQVTASVNGYDARPANDDLLIEVRAFYTATPELMATVSERLTGHVAECVAEVATERPDCPAVLYRTGNTGFVVDRMPTADLMTSGVPTDPAEPSLRIAISEGELSYTGSDGSRFSTTFNMYCMVSVAPDDELTVTFDRSL